MKRIIRSILMSQNKPEMRNEICQHNHNEEKKPDEVLVK